MMAPRCLRAASSAARSADAMIAADPPTLDRRVQMRADSSSIVLDGTL